MMPGSGPDCRQLPLLPHKLLAPLRTLRTVHRYRGCGYFFDNDAPGPGFINPFGNTIDLLMAWRA